MAESARADVARFATARVASDLAALLRESAGR
jgi:hypothetical protein